MIMRMDPHLGAAVMSQSAEGCPNQSAAEPSQTANFSSMTIAFASAEFIAANAEESQTKTLTRLPAEGAQALLMLKGEAPSHLARGIVLALYLLALVAVAIFTVKPETTLPEEPPLELVMLPAAEPVAETSPPVEPPPSVIEEIPPEAPLDEPQPVAAEFEPVAPVERKPPPPPPKPRPVTKKVVEHKPALEHPQPRGLGAATPGPSGPPSAAASSNAMPSGYANLVHARIARTAANSYPRAAMLHNQSGRVIYHIVIDPSGQLISKSITPSGNPGFDSAANESLARAAPFPAPGTNRPVSLTGAISYRFN
jgi:protein TonB